MDIKEYIQSLSRCLDLCREWTEAELRSRNGICTMCLTDYQKEIEILLGRIREVDMEKVLLELARHSKARIRSLAVPLSRVKILLSVNPYADEFFDGVPFEYMNEMWSKLYTEVERINKDMVMGIIEECGFGGWDDLFPLSDEKTMNETMKKQNRHFASRRSEAQLTAIFNSLVEKSFVVESSLSDWLFVFKGIGKLKSKIQWAVLNSRTRKPNKKSLLDFLVIMGFSEKDIRANINDCFVVNNGNPFSAKDYSKLRKWDSDVESEYHNVLCEIVK